MAGKSHKVASRHAQLKRKKTQKGPSGIPTSSRRVADPDVEEAVAVAAGAAGAEFEAPDVTSDPAVPASEAPAAPRPSRPSPVARTPRREISGEGPAAYLYVGAEFRRIMILTGVIFAALIVLGIVL